MTTKPSATEKRSNKQPWTLYLIGALILLCLASVLIKAIKPDPVDGYDAQVACKDFVRDHLKAPASAAFSRVDHSGSGSTFTVTGAVDAQNSFGATLRMNWTCTVTLNGDTWTLKSLTGLT